MPRPDYEVAVDEFMEADRAYKEMERQLLEGEVLESIFVTATRGGTPNPEVARREFRSFMDLLHQALDDRNSKLKNAADLLRQSVVLEESKWRGPDGRPTRVTYQGFEASSVTGRSFDPKSLMDGCRTHGLLERLMDLKTVNDKGQTVPLVEQKYSVDYEGVKTWLLANNLQDVLNGAYDEKEKSPQVRGPKLLAFLGDKKDK